MKKIIKQTGIPTDEPIQVSIPEPIENLQLPRPELVTFYKNI